MDLDALLSQANLLRLRGQHAEAERLVGELLKDRPHHSDGNVLMGDLALEQGRTDEALLWFGNAVDHGAGAYAQRRLMELRRTMDAEQTRQMEARVAQPAPWVSALPWLVLLAFGLLGLVALLAMRPQAVRAALPQPVTVPVTVPQVQRQADPAPERVVERVVEVPSIGITREEGLIRRALEADALLKAALRGVVYDAASGHATLTFESAEGDPVTARKTLSEAAMARLPDVKKATLRLVRGAEVVAQVTLERGPDGALAESGHVPPIAGADGGRSASE